MLKRSTLKDHGQYRDAPTWTWACIKGRLNQRDPQAWIMLPTNDCHVILKDKLVLKKKKKKKTKQTNKAHRFAIRVSIQKHNNSSA